MDKEHFVGIGIFVEIVRNGFSGCRQAYMNIVVHQKRFPRFQKIILWSHIKTDELTTGNVLFHGNFRTHVQGLPNFLDLRRSVNMIGKRGHPIEPDSPKKLLVIEPAVRFLELGMPFLRNFPKFMIDRHCFNF